MNRNGEKFITFKNRKFPVHAKKTGENSCARRKHFLLAGDSDWIGGAPKQVVGQDQDPAHQERGIIRTVFVIRKEKDSHLLQEEEIKLMKKLTDEDHTFHATEAGIGAVQSRFSTQTTQERRMDSTRAGRNALQAPR